MGFKYSQGWETDPGLRNCSLTKYLAQRGLEAKGIRASDAVWIASLDKDFEFRKSLNPEGCGEPRIANICEATGTLAALLISQGTHRLASSAEIDRWRAEDSARADWCRAQTLATAQKTSVVFSTQYAEAAKTLGVGHSSKKGKE